MVFWDSCRTLTDFVVDEHASFGTEAFIKFVFIFFIGLLMSVS